LAWADPSRGRVRETFTESDAAKLRAEEVAKSLQEGDAAAAGFRGAERARFAAILQTLEPTGLSAEVAAAQFAEAFRILGGRSVIEAAWEYALRHRFDLPTVTVPAAVATFLEDRKTAGSSKRYLQDLQTRLVHGFAAAKAKTASRRLAPCPPNLVEWLSQCAERTGPIWPHHNNTTHNAFRESARKAGLKWRENALRHSFVSYRLADLQDVARVALEAGNSPAMIFKHYGELVRPADGARWFQIRPDRVSTDADHPAMSLDPSTNGG
jgi:hypothetical protein